MTESVEKATFPSAKTSRPCGHLTVPRERLFKRLDELSDLAVTWITGLPGCGKTTLVSSYLARRGIGGPWLQLDADDADPPTFFFYLGRALAACGARGGPILPMPAPEQPQNLRAFTRRCAEIVAGRLEPRAAIVLDDFDQVRADAPLQEVVREIASSLPAGLRLFVLSRSDPPPAWARLRLHQRLAILDGQEMNLSRDEAVALAQLQGAESKRSAVAQGTVLDDLLEETGGWLAGFVWLLAESASPGARPRAQGQSQQLLFDRARLVRARLRRLRRHRRRRRPLLRLGRRHGELLLRVARFSSGRSLDRRVCSPSQAASEISFAGRRASDLLGDGHVASSPAAPPDAAGMGGARKGPARSGGRRPVVSFAGIWSRTLASRAMSPIEEGVVMLSAPCSRRCSREALAHRIQPAGSSPGGTEVSDVGPIARIAAPQYLLRIDEASGPAGSVTPVHSHPGSEAFYVLAGEQTIRGPHGTLVVKPGAPEAGHGAAMAMQVSGSGSAELQALVMFVVDATKPFSSPASLP